MVAAAEFTLRCEACGGACLKPTTLLSGHTVCEACLNPTTELPEGMVRTATPPQAPGGIGWWNAADAAERRAMPFGTKPNIVLRDLVERGCCKDGDAEAGITEDDVTCPLCYGVLVAPTVLPCGHAFCRACLVRTFDHAWDTPPSCGICRENLGGYLYYLNECARARTRQGGDETAHGGREIPVCTALDAVIRRRFPDEQRACAAEQEEEEGRLGADEGAESPTPSPSASPAASPRPEPRRAKLPCIPVFVCSVSIPGVKTGLHVFEPRYRLMMRRAIESGNRCFGMHPGGRAAHGCLLRIDRFEQLPDGRSLLECTGVRRYEVDEWGEKDGYATATVRWVADQAEPEEGAVPPQSSTEASSEQAEGAKRAEPEAAAEEPPQGGGKRRKKKKGKGLPEPPADMQGRVVYLLDAAAAKWDAVENAAVMGPTGPVSFQSVLEDQYGPPPDLLKQLRTKDDRPQALAAIADLQRHDWALPDDRNPVSRALFWVFATGITTPADAGGTRFAMHGAQDLYTFTFGGDTRCSFRQRVDTMLRAMRRPPRPQHVDAEGDDNCVIS
eukprot:TRINITY_DN4604_c0_g4_i1.p1 TRINITY_DN4604_c0_g4~~TRINITY_DN4604_c0_g4_i1.p1  ORF type:complete len:600 (+),score=203.05 TRINITY_DN4604_c0_g4_i1:129-1802(+)